MARTKKSADMMEEPISEQERAEIAKKKDQELLDSHLAVIEERRNAEPNAELAKEPERTKGDNIRNIMQEAAELSEKNAEVFVTRTDGRVQSARIIGFEPGRVVVTFRDGGRFMQKSVPAEQFREDQYSMKTLERGMKGPDLLERGEKTLETIEKHVPGIYQKVQKAQKLLGTRAGKLFTRLLGVGQAATETVVNSEAAAWFEDAATSAVKLPEAGKLFIPEIASGFRQGLRDVLMTVPRETIRNSIEGGLDVLKKLENRFGELPEGRGQSAVDTLRGALLSARPVVEEYQAAEKRFDWEAANAETQLHETVTDRRLARLLNTLKKHKNQILQIGKKTEALKEMRKNKHGLELDDLEEEINALWQERYKLLGEYRNTQKTIKEFKDEYQETLKAWAKERPKAWEDAKAARSALIALEKEFPMQLGDVSPEAEKNVA